MSTEDDGSMFSPSNTTPLFPDLDANQADTGLTEIESLCMSCYKQCEHCGHSDRSTQSGGRIQERGVQYTLTVITSKDLNREVVKSEYAVFSIPELEFEQPSIRKGTITTIEGLINSALEGLQMFQKERKEADPENGNKIDEFLMKLQNLKTLDKPFVVVIDDPTGNSYVENPYTPSKDHQLTVTHYTRTHDQDVETGCLAEDDENAEVDAEEEEQEEEGALDRVGALASDKTLNLQNEVLQFRTNCSNCNAPCSTNMKLVDIPYFKQVVIMATVCETCGVRDNEVKGGSGIEALGTRITLRITCALDLSRDILKSDTCAVIIPELELELEEGTLGGRFTTVEGLLIAIKDQLDGKNSFLGGDSAEDGTRSKMKKFCQRLNKIITGETVNVHLILDDAAGNSYMQRTSWWACNELLVLAVGCITGLTRVMVKNIFAPDPDPEMKIEHYERTFEQNETLGLNDMKTEDYSNDT